MPVKPVKRLAIVFLAFLTACAQLGPINAANDGRQLRFRGSMLVGQDGRLVMVFDPKACTTLQMSQNCGTFPYNGLPDTFLVTPWGARAQASSGGEEWLGFAVDWRAAGLDPLRDDHLAILARPWRFESARNAGGAAHWTPRGKDLVTMRQLLSTATGIEIDVRRGEPPPRLEVVALAPRAELRNGTRATLTLELANTGSGTASLVVARTLSSLPALHGLQFSFGQLAPGTREVRSLVVDLPRDNDEDEVVIVVELSEGGGFSPPPLNVRLPVREAVAAVALAMQCKVFGKPEAVPTVDAGELVTFECVVANRGAPATNVAVSAQVAGGTPVRSAGFDVGTEGEQVISLVAEVPRSARMDQQVIFELEARGDDKSPPARARVELVISRGKLCPDGRIDRKTYLERRDRVRRTHAEGLISKEQLETYEAELVGCLK